MNPQVWYSGCVNRLQRRSVLAKHSRNIWRGSTFGQLEQRQKRGLETELWEVSFLVAIWYQLRKCMHCLAIVLQNPQCEVSVVWCVSFLASLPQLLSQEGGVAFTN